MAVGQNQWYHFGVGAPPILVYFSGDGDVHWGDDTDFDPWPYDDISLWAQLPMPGHAGDSSHHLAPRAARGTRRRLVVAFEHVLAFRNMRLVDFV